MNHIITFAVIVFVIIFAIVLAKGTSFSAFFTEAKDFVERLFRRKEGINGDEENKYSQKTIGYEKVRKGKKDVSLEGSPAKEGLRVQITVFDHSDNLLGTETVYVGDIPLLIGRSKERNGYESKLCLPDVSDEPTTSRTHCTLVNNGTNIVLKDCYSKKEAFDNNGDQIHSVSKDNRTGDYIGNGFVVDCRDEAEVDIGDYIIKIKNLTVPSPRVVPTYGYKSVLSSPTRFAGSSAPKDVPTKEFNLNNKRM